MKNISSIKNCYGCGVCSIICPQKIIDIKLNIDGFYEPIITNTDSCTNCGLCLSVCAYNDNKLPDNNLDLHGYAAWSENESIRKECSSGGIGFAIGEKLIEQGYKAIGVRYNAELARAEHFVANSVEDFIPSRGSKYIPSYTLTGFSQINRKDKFFITGTPCQIDSLRRYIRKLKIEDHFVLMDFFCHGVPSMNMWKKYVKNIENKIGTIGSVSWRKKTNGWHNSYAITAKTNNLEENKQYSSFMRNGDLFYRFFLGNMCLGDACYKCKYKMTASAADLRIGDFWGKTYQSNEEGVNTLLVFTEKGDCIVKELNNCILKEELPSVAVEGQVSHSAKRSKSYYYVRQALRTNKELTKIASIARYFDLFLNLHIKLYSRIKRFFPKL